MNTKSYEPLTLTDFTDPAQEPTWLAINDGVMGGQSQGGLRIIDNRLHFDGYICLANNGGFASIRARGRHYDLSAADSILLRIRGDGRTYQFRLYTNAHYQGARIAYASTFRTTPDTWLELRLHFSQLQPTVRGRKLPGPAFNPAAVEELGFLLADKHEGSFHLCADWIKAI